MSNEPQETRIINNSPEGLLQDVCAHTEGSTTRKDLLECSAVGDFISSPSSFPSCITFETRASGLPSEAEAGALLSFSPPFGSGERKSQPVLTSIVVETMTIICCHMVFRSIQNWRNWRHVTTEQSRVDLDLRNGKG